MKLSEFLNLAPSEQRMLLDVQLKVGRARAFRRRFEKSRERPFWIGVERDGSLYRMAPILPSGERIEDDLEHAATD